MPQRVLCIERDDAFRERVKALLEREGFAVDLTGTGLEGIARALTLPPDLVLADVHLPDIEGYELAARLKQEKALAEGPVRRGRATRARSTTSRSPPAPTGSSSAAATTRSGDEVRAFLAGKRERLPEEGERAQLRALSGSMATRLETAVAGEKRASRQGRGARTGCAARSCTTWRTSSRPRSRRSPGTCASSPPASSAPSRPQQQRVLESMVLSVNRLTRIVDNLSDFASLDVGRGAAPPRRGRPRPARRRGGPGAERAGPRGAPPRRGAARRRRRRSSPTRASSARRSPTSSRTR